MEGDEFAAVEIHDFQGLVEVFHLHGVRAEVADLPELFFVAHQGREGKILRQLAIEFLALLRVVAVDFLEAEEEGREGVAAGEGEQSTEGEN